MKPEFHKWISPGWIETKDGKNFIIKHHYTKGCGRSVSPIYGVWDCSGKLMGVCAFHTPISENVRSCVFGKEYVNRVTELHRFALHPTAPKNTASWLIGKSLKLLRKHRPNIWAVISYADETVGHLGTIYQASNFIYTGPSYSTGYFYRDKDGRLRSPRQCGKNINKTAAINLGWSIVTQKCKHRYVKFIGDKWRIKECRKLFKLKSFNYPKI